VKVFADIYEADDWTNGSGPGSHPVACQPLIQFLNRFLKDNSVTSIVDFGCGDWQFMSEIDIRGGRYLGLDVVDHVLAVNRARYGSSDIAFEMTPDDLSTLPDADLLLVKDVLIHLPNAYIIDLTRNFSKFKYIITINNSARELKYYNLEIEAGGFHAVDLSLPPFNQTCATVLKYGQYRILDPRLSPPVAFALRRFLWPGEKHVQLVLGGSGRSGPR
jgi:SAM-dependent methyltransferase